jgi:hypothetical protein
MQITKNPFGVRFLKKLGCANIKWYVGSPKVGRDRIGHFLCLRCRRPCATFSKLHSAGRKAALCAVSPKCTILVSSSILATSEISSTPSTTTTPVNAAAPASDIVHERCHSGYPFSKSNNGRGVSNNALLSAFSVITREDTSTPATFLPGGTFYPTTLLSYKDDEHALQEAMNHHARGAITVNTTSASSCSSCDASGGTTAPTTTTKTPNDERKEYYTSNLAKLALAPPPPEHPQQSVPAPSQIMSSSSSIDLLLLLLDEEDQEHQDHQLKNNK